MNKRRGAPPLGLGGPPPRLVAQLDNTRVLREGELFSLLVSALPEWELAQGTTPSTLIGWMLEHTKLHQLSIHSEVRRQAIRYIWGEASPIEIAASLAPGAYFCHATAASFHGLLTYNPETIYLNREQSAKPTPDGPLSEEGIARAFSKKQRSTQDIYHWGTTRVAILCGKQSGNFGVQEHSLGDSQRTVKATEIERTLIDLTVRPDYGGGPAQVLEAFRKGRGRIFHARLEEILHHLQYRYPYHQAIGFYMQRAGYDETDLARLRAFGMNLDFYVGYGIAERDFDSSWRVHFPKTL